MLASDERGIAMVLALFLMSALSVLAASMMFLSQTETYATMNYRMMSQARYAAEAGIQRTANYLLDNAQYTPPSPGSASDPLSNYDTTVSPVICAAGATGCTAGQPITLSSTVSNSNYPWAAVKTTFAGLAHGSLTAGTATLNYTTTATLLTMQYFESYGGDTVIQTWQITSDGTMSGPRSATVQVQALIETPKVPANSYAAFATSDTCGAITFQGAVDVDSYDSSSLLGATTPWIAPTGGNVGTNGNLTLGGDATVYGDLYTPKEGVGACNAGNVNAYTGATASLNPNGLSHDPVPLPATLKYPTPKPPPFSPPYSTVGAVGPLNNTSGACAAIFPSGVPAGASCTESGDDIVIDGHGQELLMPSISVMGTHANIVLVANTPQAKYDFNSIKLDGDAHIQVRATSPGQDVAVNVTGKDNTGTDIAVPIDMEGGTFTSPDCAGTCSNFDASMLQILYGGTGEVKIKGNSGAAAVMYAPNAYINLGGTVDWYGSIVGSIINNTGTPAIHYDKRLMHDFWMAGQPAAGTFTWKRAS